MVDRIGDGGVCDCDSSDSDAVMVTAVIVMQ